MFFSSRIRLKPLAQLCHRLATATKAGIDDRRIWRSEAERGGRAQQTQVGLVAEQLERGQPIDQAIKAAGDFFPPLFRQMIAVGEVSGQLEHTYKQLAHHYDRTLAARRVFMQRMSWPAFQFGMTVFVVGLLIWVMGMIADTRGGTPVDPLGVGLVGTRGLIIYMNIVIVAGIAVMLALESARRGHLWARTLKEWALRLPVLGGALKTLALARMTWAMQLVFDTPMDLRTAIPLAMDASGNRYYSQHGPQVARSIANGASIHRSLAETGVMPTDFLDAVAVGEESGSIVETMRRLSDEYQERAADAMNMIAQIFGYVLWLGVAVLIIALIIRLFTTLYLDPIQNLL